jgi:hypothetical protein
MRYEANTEIAAWRLVDGEAVIVHAETSAYYGLNASATFIWQDLVNGEREAREIADRVRARYGADSSIDTDVAKTRDGIDTHVAEFLGRLADEGLIRKADGASPAAPVRGEVSPGATPYEPPQFERFGELEQLVLSGE